MLQSDKRSVAECLAELRETTLVHTLNIGEDEETLLSATTEGMGGAGDLSSSRLSVATFSPEPEWWGIKSAQVLFLPPVAVLILFADR